MNNENSNEYYLTLFKSKIINKIISNNVAIKLISPKINKALTLKQVLLGGKYVININGKNETVDEQGHIFDYAYVDGTTEDEKVFVCVETVPTNYSYPIIDINLCIYVYVHKTMMRLSSSANEVVTTPTQKEMNALGYIGNRCDQLIQVIGEIMNGCNNIGGISTIKPYSRNYINVSIPNKNLYGKVMLYSVKISDVEKLECDI